jgi:1D-myo-inositol-tetrakisphosphate 5-kinase/inositol-polyphosphate multikinase
VYDHDKQAPELTTKAYGYSMKPSQLPGGIAKFFPLSASSDAATGKGLPSRLLIPVLQGIRAEIEKIRVALTELELTIIGGSLLIVYEADWDQLSKGLEYASQLNGYDSESEEESEEEDTEGLDEQKSEQGKKPGPPYRVRLIDFAHTRFAAGKGPDHRLLKGVLTVLDLLEGRIKELTK